MVSMVVAWGPGGEDGWGSGGWIWPILWIVFWIAVVVGIVYLMRRRPGGPPTGSGSAEALLAERFARGEISEEEYRERLAVLRERR